MDHWKTEPIYRLIFLQVESLRDRLRVSGPIRGVPPEGYRIEEHDRLDWGHSGSFSGLRLVWIHDDYGPRLFPGLRHYPHDPGEIRGAFWQFGLIRFALSDDHRHLEMALDVGPGLIQHLDFDVVGCEEATRLVLLEGSLSGSF